MRLLGMLLSSIVAVVLGYLFRLPWKMADDAIVTKLTEFVSERFGITIPVTESFVRVLTFLVPFAAAAATIHLYHRAVIFSGALAPKLITEQQRTISRLYKGLAAVISFVILISFVGYTLYIGYTDHPVAAESLRFRGFAHISNYQLRERAFAVSGKIKRLWEEYESRQHEINAQYAKELDKWEKQNSEYQQEVQQYNFCYQPSPLFGTNTSTNCPQRLGFVTPAPPQPPPPKPEPPSVPVDKEWTSKMLAIQEEAAAVREEIHHRLGNYAPWFDIPPSYNYYSQNDDNLSSYAKYMETLGNDLH